MATDPPASSRHDLEPEIRAHAQAGRWEEAATCALQGYGGEVLGFLHAVVGEPADAEEVFSAVCEAVWVALPRFRFESTFRTWLYAVARNTARERSRARQRRERRFAELDGNSAAAKVAAHVRSTTAIHLRSETKDRLRAIRDSLSPDDRMLLVLRVDRHMAWDAIARILADGALDPADASRASSRLRKRFERVKAKVAELLKADAGGE